MKRVYHGIYLVSCSIPKPDLAPDALQKTNVVCRNFCSWASHHVFDSAGVTSQNLRSSGRSDGLCDLGDLIAGADDLLTLTVFVELHVLVLPLCSLPDLDFAAAADDADAHCGEEVVRGVGVHVDASVEHGGGVFADAAADHGFPAWVFFDEFGDIVDDSRDGDETAAVLGLVLEVVPFHDW